MHGQQAVHTYNRDYVSIIKLNQKLPNYKEQFGFVEINFFERPYQILGFQIFYKSNANRKLNTGS